jgi:hypothetical protein
MANIAEAFLATKDSGSMKIASRPVSKVLFATPLLSAA